MAVASTAAQPGQDGVARFHPAGWMEVVVLGSGSSGNALLVRGGGTAVLVDAGLSALRLRRCLRDLGVEPDALAGILLTHEHGDHTAGLRGLHNRCPVPLFANALTAEATRYAAKSPLGPWQIFTNGHPFRVGAFNVQSFSVPHDAADPVGFVLELNGTRLGVATDFGKVTRSVVEILHGVHGLILETNYDEELLEKDPKRPWATKQRIRSPHGHLSNAAAAELTAGVATAALQMVILGHLSKDCNRPELAMAAVAGALAATPGRAAAIHCAPQDGSSHRFSLAAAAA